MMRRGVGRGGRPGLVGTMARTAVIAGTATAVSGNVARRQGARAEASQAPEPVAAAPEPAPEPAPAGAITDDTVEQLKKLAELKDAGILTEEEFADQKAKVLGT